MLHLVADAECSQVADPAYRAELARWVGGERDRDGIPDSALGPRAATGLTPIRDSTPARPDPVRYASFEIKPQLAVLSQTHPWRRPSAGPAVCTPMRGCDSVTTAAGDLFVVGTPGGGG